MWSNVRADSGMLPTVPDLKQLSAPPKITQYQKQPHAIFNYGGLEFLFFVTEMPFPFPQCDAVQTLENELMVVGANPLGYVFFTDT